MSPIGQAIQSMNHDALRLILTYDDTTIHEAQIIDKNISHKILTPIHYICKLIRIRGMTEDY
jgi:hypothetical protein